MIDPSDLYEKGNTYDVVDVVDVVVVENREGKLRLKINL